MRRGAVDLAARAVQRVAADVGEPMTVLRSYTYARAAVTAAKMARLYPQGSDMLVLTDRELEVLKLTAQGTTNPEIGRRLFLSEETVKSHLRRVFQKLGARDRAHAVALAMAVELLTAHDLEPVPEQRAS